MLDSLYTRSLPITRWDLKGETETTYERKLRMLRPLNLACMACTMCELGRKDPERGGLIRDPHVFSNMNPAKFVILGQNPGWNELKEREPFVGQAGITFDKEIIKHGLSRDDFYISNVVRCYTEKNAKPNNEHITRCRPFLEMELTLIRPHFVITLGAVAFGLLCPGAKYSDALGAFTESEEYNIQVMAIYHPSPLNLADKARKKAFQAQIKRLCKLVKAVADPKDK